MSNNAFEDDIRKAFESAAPDIKGKILSDLKKKKKGKVLKMPENAVKSTRFWTRIAAVAAALIMMAGIGAGIGRLLHGKTSAAFASVMIDVNPSIELAVNRAEKVVSAIPRNDDGKNILADMDLAGSGVKVAVNAIIGAMVRSGYLNELANSILITVTSDDMAFEYRLRDSLGADVRDNMDSRDFGYAVLSQTLDADPDTDALADFYGVTRSKAQLIRRLIASNPAYSFSDLAALSINELGLLSGCNAVEDLREYGRSSDRAYIGEEAALEIAFKHAGITADDASAIEIELDCEHGKMVYDIEFDARGMEYDYDIDAVTGEVLKPKSEPGGDQPRPTEPAATTAPALPTAAPAVTPAPSAKPALISSEKALQIALDHAGAKKADARNVEVELERDDGDLIYEVEFRVGKTEYDYEIDAVSGRILDHSSETDGDHHSGTPKPTQKPAQQTPVPSQKIGSQAALDIAFLDANVSAEEARNVEVAIKTRHGVKVYEVEFDHGKYEYDYVINAKTGEIIDRSRESEDDGHQGGHDHSNGFIGKEKALQIALDRAGLSLAEITGEEIERDTDNGVSYYEIEFKCAGYEYEVKINAVTGAVMSFEKELDD